MKTLRTILRSFVLGAITGYLVAPRAGQQTREMLRERWDNLLDRAAGIDTSAGGGDYSAGGSGVREVNI